MLHFAEYNNVRQLKRAEKTKRALHEKTQLYSTQSSSGLFNTSS